MAAHFFCTSCPLSFVPCRPPLSPLSLRPGIVSVSLARDRQSSSARVAGGLWSCVCRQAARVSMAPEGWGWGTPICFFNKFLFGPQLLNRKRPGGLASAGGVTYHLR